MHIPGRMGRKRGKTLGSLKIQYATTPGGGTGDPANGLKCIYTWQGSWQEVFLVCHDAAEAQRWLETNGVVTPGSTQGASATSTAPSRPEGQADL